MKLSLRWIFDHINADWRTVDVQVVVQQFNKITAEIEGYEWFNLNLRPFACGTVSHISDQTITLNIPEWRKTVDLPYRTDITERNDTHGYLVYRENEKVRWATLLDWTLDKEGLLPAFEVTPQMCAGGWRDLVEVEDVILDVDNKSITHRPDMWGHRGFAREIAAFMNLKLKDESDFVTKRDVTYFDGKSEQSGSNPFTLVNDAPDKCNQFAGLYFSKASNVAANFFIGARLARVECRTINGIVDLSNYLMLDWSQPNHAYDAEKIANSTLIVRMAQPGEKLVLLGDQKIELTKNDLLIADPEKVLGLAGIKGGKHDSINDDTATLFLESANFDAACVRKSAAFHSVRTEASARFEKTLDPNQAIVGIQRFLKLADQFGVALQPEGNIICVGKKAEPLVLTIKHSFLESRSGISFKPEQVLEILTKLTFGVEQKEADDGVVYQITVPTFRCTKDVTIKEDILEEVVRCFGFEHIPHLVPALEMSGADTSRVFKLRKIKNYLSSAARMMEQQNYAFFDEQFLQQIAWEPPTTPHMANPVSSDQYRLVSSLLPGLFKNLVDNRLEQDNLSYFEIAPVWQRLSDEVIEQMTLSGLFACKRGGLDFYEYKARLQGLFDLLKLRVTWEKHPGHPAEWSNVYQTAQIRHGEHIVGYAGTLKQTMNAKLDMLVETEIFVFELNAELLLSAQAQQKRFAQMSRYQGATFDLSFMMPLSVTTAAIEEKLRGLSALVTDVKLVDFFERDEWSDARSLAFRVWLEDSQKTLEKDQIEQVRHAAISALEDFGGTIRS